MTLAWRLVTGAAPPWNDLCVKHDKAYWAGGTAAQRSAADRALMAGVTLNGHPIIAFLMWCAVRIGGHPLIPTSWRWGYGWAWPRNYQLEATNDD